MQPMSPLFWPAVVSTAVRSWSAFAVPGGHRTFRFAEPIDPRDIGAFYTSQEKRVIDSFRELKGLLLRSA